MISYTDRGKPRSVVKPSVQHFDSLFNCHFVIPWLVRSVSPPNNEMTGALG